MVRGYKRTSVCVCALGVSEREREREGETSVLVSTSHFLRFTLRDEGSCEGYSDFCFLFNDAALGSMTLRQRKSFKWLLIEDD